MMLGAFPDFKVIIKKAYENLEPGGWFESQELWPRACCVDGTMPEDWKFIEWAANQDEAAMNANQPLRIANKLARWYKEAGFVDVQQHICRIPIGGYLNEAQPKMIGKFWLRQLIEGLPAFTMAYFTRHLGWSPDQVEVYLVEVRKALKDLETRPRIHAFHQLYVYFRCKQMKFQLTMLLSTAI
jgi:metalloendopeptidase OMA1, mitochondrial